MSFFEELKRRNVIRVGIAYVVIAWLLAQVADLALDSFEAPGWVIKPILLVLVTAYECSCGSPFDLDATPNFKARLKQAGIEWNPPSIIDFPAKDW